MVAVEFVVADTGEPDAALAASVAKACIAEGVIVVTCGTYGNVIRFLPPLTTIRMTPQLRTAQAGSGSRTRGGGGGDAGVFRRGRDYLRGRDTVQSRAGNRASSQARRSAKTSPAIVSLKISWRAPG